MKLINYSLVDINKDDIYTAVVGGVKLKLIKEGSEYQKTTQKGVMHTPQEGIGIKKGELVWFFHQAVDTKTDYFGDLKYAIQKELILGVERNGKIEPTSRIIATATKRPPQRSGVIIIDEEPQQIKHLFKVESAPKESGFKSGDYVIPRKNMAYHIPECDKYFIEPSDIIAYAEVKTSGELITSYEVKELFNGHHIVKKQAIDGDYEKVGSIFLQKTHLYQPQWCFVVKSDKFKESDRVFCVKSMGGDIEINGEPFIAVNNEQLYFAQ